MSTLWSLLVIYCLSLAVSTGYPSHLVLVVLVVLAALCLLAASGHRHPTENPPYWNHVALSGLDSSLAQ